MAIPTIPALVGTSDPATTILSKSARRFSTYQHPTVEKALQAKSELPKRRDVFWFAGLLALTLGLLVVSYSRDAMAMLERNQAVLELLQIVGWQRFSDGLPLLALRIGLAALSLIYSASLYYFLKVYTTATIFTVPAPPPSNAPAKTPPLLSSEQLSLLFPTQAPKALAKLPEAIQSVKEAPSQASHFTASLLKATKIVIHDAATSAAHRLRRKNEPETLVSEPATVSQLQKPPAEKAAPSTLLAPLHPAIQKPPGGSTVALWGSGGKGVSDRSPSGTGTLPGNTVPAFGRSSFAPTSVYMPLPSPLSTQIATVPTDPEPVAPTENSGFVGGPIRDRSLTPLRSEQAFADFLADLDRRMETPTPHSPPFGATPETGAPQNLDARFQGPLSPGLLSPAGSGYFPQQSDLAGHPVGVGMYPQTPNIASPLFGAPTQTTPTDTGAQPQGICPLNSPYSPPAQSPSPAPYAPSAPPLPQQSPISNAAGPNPYGAPLPAYAANQSQTPLQGQQPEAPSPYSGTPSAYGAYAPSPYGAYPSPYTQSPDPYAPSQFANSPQSNSPYPVTPPIAYNQSPNPSGIPASPYSPSPSSASPFQGGPITPAASPLLPSGRPLIRSSPSQPKPGVSAGVKADRDMPHPMPPEVIARRLKGLEILAQDLDSWRDELRVWFAEKLLGPLVKRMDVSPAKVQNTCAGLNITLPVALTPLGTDSKAAEAVAAVTAASLAVPAAPGEEQVLKVLGEKLEEERKKAMQPPAPAPPSMFGQQQATQQRPNLSSIQACLDAVTENQRLRLLLRGELAPKVLPLPSVQPTFTARRIKELAEGACVKRYDWSGGGDVIPGQPWTAAANLPGDAHLLFYLFTAFLEFPGWNLHQEPLTGPGHQGGFFFVGDLPKRLPEQFVAVLQPPLSSELRTAIRQPKATVVLVGKQSPAPVFYLLWGGKFQFVLQGRTAIWDTIALLVYRLRQSHGGAIRGISLDSSTMQLPPSISPT